MIKNEDTYCKVQHKIVRELGAWEAVVYGTIADILRKKDGYGNVSNQTLIDLIGRDKKSIYRWIERLIDAGYLEKVGGKGRSNISIYYTTKKGGDMTPFIEEEKRGQIDTEKGANMTKKGGNMTPFIEEEKRGQIDTEKGANMTEKGGEMPPINTGINKEINKESSLSSFDGSKAAKEEEDKIFIEENKHKSEITQEDENAAVEDIKRLFAEDEEKIAPETKSSFAEFWRLFAPNDRQQCKYKIALKYWNEEMPENWRAAMIEMLRRGARPNQDNPYFFLQHFSPVKYFLNEREQYQAYKQGVRLCSVRWNRDQRVMAAIYAEIFRMEIIDNHYEKRFEI